MLPHLLPMTVFEEYMLLDGTAQYPMDCHIRLHFSGGFNHEAVENAFVTVFPNHPFLCSRCQETKKYRFAWVLPDFSTPQPIQHFEGYNEIFGVKFLWLEGKCREQYPPDAQVGLAPREGGEMLRFYFLEEKGTDGRVERTDFIIKCHHSASDGIGMFQCLADFLVKYAQLQGVEMPEWENRPKTDVDALASRQKYGRTLWERTKLLATCTAHLPRSFKLILHRVQPITVPAPIQENHPKGTPALYFCTISSEKTSRILKRSREQGFTFNDAMLQAVWCGTKTWRERHPESTTNERNAWIRIAVPSNLRHPRQKNFPASNIVSMLFCDRREKDVNTSADFRQTITREMNHVKKYSLGFLLIQSLRDARNVCGNLYGAVKMCKCWASMVLTNVGPVFTPKALPFPRNSEGKLQLGGLVLEEIESASPIREQTTLSICCITYAGSMQFSLIYDPLSMSRDEAKEYLDDVLESLDEICSIKETSNETTDETTDETSEKRG